MSRTTTLYKENPIAAENTPIPATPNTIVLIHELWMTPLSWEHWIEHYEGKGYRVLAPAYPGLEVAVEALTEDPSPIKALTIPGVVEHYEGIIGELEKPPILMGHSMGGLIVQILLDHGYGAAGVAVESLRHSPTRFIQLLQRVYACLTPSHGGGCNLSLRGEGGSSRTGRQRSVARKRAPATIGIGRIVHRDFAEFYFHALG